MATLTYYYPEQYRRSDPDTKYVNERSLAYMPLNLQGALVLYGDNGKPLLMFWVEYGDMQYGLKTRLQNAFKRKPHYDDTGMFSWTDMDELSAASYLTSHTMFQLDLFWRNG